MNLPVAIGVRLSQCPWIQTLGFKPNFCDYTVRERQLILDAPRVYYPTSFYADLFHTMGKKTFPSFHTYRFAQDKIRQTAMFHMQGIPHPRTHTFYGKKQKKMITGSFAYPFIAKKARGSSRGDHVYLIENHADLQRYLDRGGPAYIQEYLPIERDMRIIVIGKQVALAYWRVMEPGEYRTNISRGGRIVFDPLPPGALALALDTATRCGWDDVGIDIIETSSRFYVLEANMKYGTRGFKKAGISYKKLLCSLVNDGKI